MNWFLMVLVTSMVGDLHEGFLWYDPTFSSKQECLDWANNNPVAIIQTLDSQFINWEIKELVCVREDRFKDLNLQPYPGKTI